MKYAEAQELLENGKAVTRKGWNDKGMFAYYVPEGRYKPTTKIGEYIAAKQTDGLVPYNPYYALVTTHGTVQAWQPNTIDQMAKDWQEYHLE